MATRKADRNREAETLLVELLTEELPPKSLPLLSKFFADEVANGLIRHQLKLRVPDWKSFATPRRLVVIVPDVLAVGEDRSTDISGPSTKAPPEAVAGFAKKQGVEVGDLRQEETPKGKVYVARVLVKGASLDTVLPDIVTQAAKKLPAPKLMRWGNGEAQFARPVHGLVMLHGSHVVSGEVLGAESSNKTLGHRFLASGEIALKSATDYEAALRDKGKVIAGFGERRAEIVKELEKAAAGATLVVNDALLDEVTAIVEAPVVYAGAFSPDFLAVPEECLILSMQQHQRYVPLRDKTTEKLLPRFLFVSNIPAKDPGDIIRGNERVLRARLSDAKFFYEQDRKTRLDARVPRLANVVYVNKLGSQLDRVERIKVLAGRIARQIGADPSLAERAAWLSKADLLTEMVGEFPELQGIMGSYYALHDGESKEVADSIEQHYRPRFAGDSLPQGKVATAVALADKIDGVVGIFGIGQAPSGDKDPFALRRAAFGIVRIVAEQRLPVSLEALINDSTSTFQAISLNQGEIGKVHGFLLDRLRSYFRDLSYKAEEIEAVVGSRLDRVIPVIKAVRQFRSLPEAESLAAANKRIRNILRQQNYSGDGTVNDSSLTEPAERALYDEIRRVLPHINASLQREDFTEALCALAGLKSTVDTFFDKVLVNTEDQGARRSRLALLAELSGLMNQVADISKLAA